MKKEMMLALIKKGQQALSSVVEEAHSDILSGELNGVLALAVMDDINIDVLTLRRDLMKLIYEIEETLEWVDGVLDKLDEMQSDLEEIEEQIAEQEEEDYDDEYELESGCCPCCGC